MKHTINKIIIFLVFTLFFVGKQEVLSECFSWNDVVDKYNAYVGAQNNWNDVMACYTEYVTLNDAFVTTTDYQTGHFAAINLEDQSVKKYDLNLSSDAVAKTINHRIYVVNRYGQDNITVLSPTDFSKPLIQFSTGNGSNPQDIVLSTADKAYISLFQEKYLLVVNPNTGEEQKRIDLSSFADSDGFPEPTQMVIVDNVLFITLQKLDRNTYQPAENGAILMIDTLNDSIIGSITLSGQNPYDMAYSDSMGKLIISETGSFNDLTDGGIETIDLGTRQPSGFILSEEDFGGNITDFAMKPSSSQGYIIVAEGGISGSPNTFIASFDLVQAVKLKDVLRPNAGFIHAGIATTSEMLLVGDRCIPEEECGYKPGVRIISTLTDEEITTKPINTGLPPFSITVY